jgi:hypothetical protein
MSPASSISSPTLLSGKVFEAVALAVDVLPALSQDLAVRRRCGRDGRLDEFESDDFLAH